MAVRDIVNLSQEEFAVMIAMHKLTYRQRRHWQDIRKRGKNALAAARSRKRAKNKLTNLRKQAEEARLRTQRQHAELAEMAAEKQREAKNLDDLMNVLTSLTISAHRGGASQNEKIVENIGGPLC